MTMPLEDTAHVISLALTPIFLLTGIAALLNVFSNRLARVADKLDKLVEQTGDSDFKQDVAILQQMNYLRRRSRVLDLAVILGALAGANTCAATFTLFVGVLRESATGSVLFFFLGFAILCTLGALAAYLFEMLIASRGIRAEVTSQQRSIVESTRH